ncbi:MAG: acyltransferase [Propionivibrio sp.]
MNRTQAIPLAPAPGGRYTVLDLMRGLAALAVLLFHMNYMLGSATHLIARGYLAVNFFFILSGFVIAANYHAAVRPALSWQEFLAARIARLWPLFLLTTLIGFVAVTMKATRDLGFLDAPDVFYALALNVLMLPSFVQSYGVDRLFYFNAASWSIFFELAVNLVFIAGLRRLGLKPLLALAAGSAVLLVFAARANGSLDGGLTAATFHLGSLRVLFGFTAGMVVYLCAARSRLRAGGPATAAAVAGLCLALWADGNWISDSVLAVAVFPTLVLIGAQGRLGAPWERVGGWLGDVSYSVYLLQTPAMLFASWAFKLLVGRKIAEFAPYSGVVFVIALLGASYLCWRFFELPARNWLRRRLVTPGGAARRTAGEVA